MAKTSTLFDSAKQYFNALPMIACQWTSDRTSNALWGGDDDGGKSWEWLMNGRKATQSDFLRFVFLATPTCASDSGRRRRVLLNLLDASIIDHKNSEKALSAGLDFLLGEGELANINGFSPEQLADEVRKWPLPSENICEFERDELVCNGSLQFIGWADFASAEDVSCRLGSIRSAICDNWIGFYRNLAARILDDAIGEKEYVHAPVSQDDTITWREKILTNRLFIRSLRAWHADPAEPRNIPCWVKHLCELLTVGKVEVSSLRKLGGWMFLLQNEKRRSPSGKSIRLDCNDYERNNRQLLKLGEIYYADPWPWVESKTGGSWFNVCNKTWWKSAAPIHVIRNADGSFPEIEV